MAINRKESDPKEDLQILTQFKTESNTKTRTSTGILSLLSSTHILETLRAQQGIVYSVLSLA